MIRSIVFATLAIVTLATSTFAGEPDKAPVRIDRLEKLAAYMDQLQKTPDRLNMPSYSDDYNRSADDPSSRGCAWFHSSAKATFAAEGVILGPGGPSYKGLPTKEAVEAFFGLSEADAAALFGHRRRQPAEEAAMLRSVANRERARLARIEAKGLCELAAW